MRIFSLAVFFCFLSSWSLFATYSCKALECKNGAGGWQRLPRQEQQPSEGPARVSVSGPVYDRAGNMVGRCTMTGKFVGLSGKVRGMISGDGRVYDIKTKEELVFIGDLKNAEDCRAYVYKQAETAFGKACDANMGKGVERAVVTYYDRDGILRNERIDDGNGTSEATNLNFKRLRQISEIGGKLVAITHNHPTGGCGGWPSNLDAEAMANVKQEFGRNVDFYIADCRHVNGQEDIPMLTLLSSEDGKVYNVSANGHIVKSSVAPANCAVGSGDHDLYDPKIGDRKTARNTNRKFGQKKKEDVEKTLGLANVQQHCPSGEVGVRGWCKCGGRKDKGCCCGYGAICGASAADCPYVYMLCRRCGKCMRDSDNLIDVKVEEALQKAKHMTTSQLLAERKRSQDRLLTIPDGQIVFPGKCVCKKPDAIKVGGSDKKEFHVCLFCGRYYVPGDSTVPIGPTARKERGLK